MYEKLLNNISKRFGNENALSDITWAYCQTNDKFRHWFLKFFFDDIEENHKIDFFSREFQRGNSRPDFFLKANNGEYIIESKIYDRNHHFEQYKNVFPNAKFGYIANYKIAKRENVYIKTWTELYNYLSEISELLDDVELLYFLKSYLAFLKPVCNINNINVMRLDSLSSLYSLNAVIMKILCDNEQMASVDIDESVRSFSETRYGKYYGIEIIGSEKKIWPWIGVYFDEDSTIIYIEINEQWCEKSYDFLKTHPELKDGMFYDQPYFNKDIRPAFCFELKEICFKNLNEMTDSKDQEQLLKNFICEVFNFLNLRS